jgi:ribosome-associated toxin RatA of RatAB toxin-antitoxin module
MEIRKEMLVGWPAPAMFDLIEQAEGYPEFLPWCASSTILERSDDVVAATINVDYRGVRFSFSTRNPKRRPEWLQVQLVSGPFRRFEGEWQLVPLGDAGCRVTFMLRYEFDSTLMKRLASPVFDRIADTLLDALVTHADRRFVDTPPPANAAATSAPVPSPAPAPAAEPVDAAPAPAPAAEPVHAAPSPATAAERADAAPAPSLSPEPSTRSSA